MKVTWLGQAGLMICTQHTTVMIDPYLSNSVYEHNPAYNRRVPVDGRFLEICPDVLADLPADIDVAFLPVNGVGNNMNMTDAARFAQDCGARQVVPIHIGLFDDLKAEDFPCENKLALKMYEEVEL